MRSRAQAEAEARYKRKSVRQLNVPLFPGDRDIAEWLDAQPRKAQYVRELIREDMRRASR